MGLDRRGWALEAHALDHVRIERALDQPSCFASLAREGFKLRDEQPSNDLPLAFGIADAIKSFDKSSGCVNELQLHLKVFGEGLTDQLRFPLPQEPVIDEQAGQPIPDGAVGQRRGHRRIHAAAERAEYPPGPRLIPDGRNGIRHEGPHGPIRLHPADVVDKVLQDRRPTLGMRDFGVELKAVYPTPGRRRLHRSHWRIRRTRDGAEPLGHLLNPVAVRHPDGRVRPPLFKPLEQIRGVVDQQRGRAVLALRSPCHLPPQDLRHELHPVADAQDRDPCLQ